MPISQRDAQKYAMTSITIWYNLDQALQHITALGWGLAKENILKAWEATHGL